MKKKMITLTIFFLIGLLASIVSYHFTHNGVLFSVMITFGTCLYHFAIRLLVGGGINAIYHNKMNYNRWWFRQRRYEAKLYKFLRVRKWSKRLPTYNPEYYDTKKHSIEEIIQTTCQSEIVHEINMVLSLVPIVFTIWFGSLIAFLITSVIAFLFDSLFVILQRYNRPKLMRVAKRWKNI